MESSEPQSKFAHIELNAKLLNQIIVCRWCVTVADKVSAHVMKLQGGTIIIRFNYKYYL